MIELNPLISRYLRQLEAELDANGVPPVERSEILREIGSHATEAEQSGQTIATVLENLGPARELAHSYAAALFLLPIPRVGAPMTSRLVGTISRAGVVCASLLLVIIMGTIGAGLTLTGAASVLGGIVLPFVSHTWLDPTLRRGFPQIVVIVVGIVLFIVGVLSLRLVRINVGMIARALRRSIRENQS